MTACRDKENIEDNAKDQKRENKKNYNETVVQYCNVNEKEDLKKQNFQSGFPSQDLRLLGCDNEGQRDNVDKDPLGRLD